MPSTFSVYLAESLHCRSSHHYQSLRVLEELVLLVESESCQRKVRKGNSLV